MKRSQKIILASIAVALLALGLITYTRLMRTAKQSAPSPVDTDAPSLYLPGTETNLPTAKVGDGETLSLNQVLAGNVATFWMDESDLTLYTVTAGGAVVATPHNGSSEALYPGDGRPLITAQPNPMGDMVLLTTGSQIEPVIALFNVITQKRIFLPTTARSAMWHPNGKDVLYLRDADTKNSAGIYQLNAAKNSAAQLSSFAMIGVTLQPHTKQSILLVEPPTREAPTRSWIYNLTEKTLVAFEPAAPGFMVRWSEYGYGLVFTSRSGLTLVNQSTHVPLGMPATLPAKCALGASSLVCAVPQNALAKSPDNYLQKAEYSIDELYEIALTGEKKRIWDGPSQGLLVDAYHLKKMGGAYYFINRYDNKLYSLSFDE